MDSIVHNTIHSYYKIIAMQSDLPFHQSLSGVSCALPCMKFPGPACIAKHGLQS